MAKARQALLAVSAVLAVTILAALVVAILTLGRTAAAQQERSTASHTDTAHISSSSERIGTKMAEGVEPNAAVVTESSGSLNNVSGRWTLFYDWGCTGSYSAARMTFYPDGTFSISEGYRGLWVEEAGMLMFTFNKGETTYAGNRTSKSVTGISTAFEVDNDFEGCFFMVQKIVPTAFAAGGKTAQRDVAGNE